jgi:hypothetical protein
MVLANYVVAAAVGGGDECDVVDAVLKNELGLSELYK